MPDEYGVLLGGAPLNRGVLEVFRQMGLKTAIVDFRQSIPLSADAHILFDAKDPGCVAAIHDQGIENIKLVYTSMDEAGPAQQAVCDSFGMLHADSEPLRKAHCKDAMHAQWKKDGLLNRESQAFTTYDDAITDVNFRFKTIIKPVDACASRGITILERNAPQEALRKAFAAARHSAPSGVVNVEEFVDGTEFTVEMLGDTYGNVAVFSVSKKYHSANAGNNKVAIKLHYNPNDVPDELQRDIAEYGVRCYRSLGLKNCLGHLEMLLKKDGTLSPVEIGARSSGYIASHLVDVTSGQSFLGKFASVLHGGAVPHGILPQRDESSMYFFYDVPPETRSVKAAHLMQYTEGSIRSIACDRSMLTAGRSFPKLATDTDRIGYEILVGKRTELTIERVMQAEERFLKDFFHENNG